MLPALSKKSEEHSKVITRRDGSDWKSPPEGK
jgi:hypothetical protein